MAATTKMVEELAEQYVRVLKHDYAYITQEKYDRWIKNMSKNKSGTSLIFEPNGDGHKLYKNDDGNLYFINSKKGYTFLKVKSVEQEEEAKKKAAAAVAELVAERAAAAVERVRGAATAVGRMAEVEEFVEQLQAEVVAKLMGGI